ncbi:hypothetical protein DFH09DRAFT_1081457 [Mycena vulgaris]|nr:hypothetical protein DFH09DRAFT_1081457 [Mycena vulgaris]
MAYVGWNQHKSAGKNTKIDYVSEGYIRFGQNPTHPSKIGSDKSGPIGHNRDVASQGIMRGPRESRFYGKIQFGFMRTPYKAFDYSPPQKRRRAAFQVDENIAPAGATSSSPTPPDAA